MAGGSKKRKAVKKKGKNGDARSNSNSSSNSSSTHSQDRTMSGSENPRPLDDRESDSGEVKREEEEKEDAKAVDYEKVKGKDGKGLSDKLAEIEKMAIYEKSVSDAAKETPISILIREDSVPHNGAIVQDKEVVVEEERSMVAVWENLKDLHGDLVSRNYQVNPTPEQETIIAKDASVTPVKDASSLSSGITESGSIKNAELALQISDVKEEFSSISKEKTVSEIVYKDEEKSSVAPIVDVSSKYEGFKTSADIQSPLSSGNGITESGSIKSAEPALQIPDVKEHFFTISKGQQPVETVSEIVYKYEEKSSVAPRSPPVDLSSKYEGYKTFETGKQLEQLVAPAFDLSSKLDDFKTLETIKQVEEQFVPPAVDLKTKLDDFKTLETSKQVKEQPVPPSVDLSTKLDDFNTLDAAKHEEEKSVPLSTNLDDFKTLETDKHLEEESIGSAVTTKPAAESVKNKETVEQSDSKAGLMVENTSSEVDNVREIETRTRSIDQTLIAPNPLPIQRTSWLGCCGLFEAFSGTSK